MRLTPMEGERSDMSDASNLLYDFRSEWSEVGHFLMLIVASDGRNRGSRADLRRPDARAQSGTKLAEGLPTGNERRAERGRRTPPRDRILGRLPTAYLIFVQRAVVAISVFKQGPYTGRRSRQDLHSGKRDFSAEAATLCKPMPSPRVSFQPRRAIGPSESATLAAAQQASLHHTSAASEMAGRDKSRPAIV
jgi:hypothetical protein